MTLLSNFRKSVPATLLTCLAVAAPLLVTSAPAAAATGCTGAGATLDARLARMADRGVAPFVQFVHRTRMVYQIDVAEAVARVAQHRQAVAACTAVEEVSGP